MHHGTAVPIVSGAILTLLLVACGSSAPPRELSSAPSNSPTGQEPPPGASPAELCKQVWRGRNAAGTWVLVTTLHDARLSGTFDEGEWAGLPPSHPVVECSVPAPAQGSANGTIYLLDASGRQTQFLPAPAPNEPSVITGDPSSNATYTIG